MGRSRENEVPSIQRWDDERVVVIVSTILNSLTAKSVLAGEKLVATYSIST